MSALNSNIEPHQLPTIFPSNLAKNVRRSKLLELGQLHASQTFPPYQCKQRTIAIVAAWCRRSVASSSPTAIGAPTVATEHQLVLMLHQKSLGELGITVERVDPRASVKTSVQIRVVVQKLLGKASRFNGA